MQETGDWETRLSNMHGVVEQWMQRTSGEHEPEGPEPGSSLAADDRLFPHYPVSSAVWHGLLTAVEHLSFFHTALATSRTMYPAAYFTVLRTALLGSAQAVWVLEPASRAERQKRALTVAATDAREQRKVIAALPARSAAERAEQQTLIGKQQDILAEIDHAAIRLGFPAGKGATWSLNATEVIHEAARIALDPDTRDAPQVLWRISSGHVHGHAYSRLLQLTQDHLYTDPTGQTWGRSSSTLEAVGTHAAACLLQTGHAWKQWDRRRRNHRA
ncbi:hypothetical protein ACFV6B_36725 [Streptomyces microflavus]|uniref:hypothetical protein n=1 Tax=Streptomyces microflavus TaxID=1919 RepID=UPI0036577038